MSLEWNVTWTKIVKAKPLSLPGLEKEILNRVWMTELLTRQIASPGVTPSCDFKWYTFKETYHFSKQERKQGKLYGINNSLNGEFWQRIKDQCTHSSCISDFKFRL